MHGSGQTPDRTPRHRSPSQPWQWGARRTRTGDQAMPHRHPPSSLGPGENKRKTWGFSARAGEGEHAQGARHGQGAATSAQTGRPWRSRGGARIGGGPQPQDPGQRAGHEQVGPDVEPDEEREGPVRDPGRQQRGGGEVVERPRWPPRRRRRFPRRRGARAPWRGPDQLRPSVPRATATPKSPTSTGSPRTCRTLATRRVPTPPGRRRRPRRRRRRAAPANGGRARSR